MASIRRNEQSPLLRIKSLTCFDNIPALRDEREIRADEGLLSNTAGQVVCASAANLLAITSGRVVHAALRGWCVVRHHPCRRIVDSGVAEEPSLTLALATGAAEIPLISALSVGETAMIVNGRWVGEGAPGPAASALQALL